MAGVAVRDISSDSDWSALLAHYDACGWRRPSKGRKPDHFILAWQGEDLIGSILFRVAEAPILQEAWEAKYRQASRLEIQEILVAPALRSQGVGRKLVRRAAEIATRDGIDFLWAWPAPRGTPAERQRRINFFAVCGMYDADLDPNEPNLVGAAADVLLATGSS
jgi:GNAT superfamily N-acetyltransferase